MTAFEPHEPIRFLSADEIRCRHKWVDGLDADQHRLKAIIGDYSFAKDQAWSCGLKNCRTKHQNGYVVETEDGYETHIGSHCGNNHFGVIWGGIRAQYNRNKADRDRRAWLEWVLTRKADMLGTISDLLTDLKADTLRLEALLGIMNKEPAITAALIKAVRENGAIRVAERVNAETAEGMGLSETQRSSFITVGQLAGIQAFGSGVLGGVRHYQLLPGNRIRSSLERAHLVLWSLTADSLTKTTARERPKMAEDLRSVQDTIAEAQELLGATRQFLAPANVRQLGKLDVSPKNDRVRRIVKRLSVSTN